MSKREPEAPDTAPAAAETTETGISRRASVAALAVAVAGLIPVRAARAADPPHPDPTTSESHQRSPAARITSVHGKLRHIVMACEDYGFLPGGPAAANAIALQNAVNDAQVINLPDAGDVAEFASAITIPPYTQLIGAGADRSKLKANGAIGFVHISAPPGHDIEGPKFAEFWLNCAGTGIKLNDAAGGFSGAEAAVQKTIMRPRFDRLKLSGSSLTGSAAGIELNKCFSAVIDQCWIAGFGIGVKTRGCDFPAITGRSRIWLCETLIQCDRDGTFGSGMLIDGADLLLAGRSFIRSSDRHLIVRDSYFEKQSLAPLTGPVLDIDHSYMALLTGNRFEVPASHCPKFLSVKGEGSLFVFEHNSHGGEDWGQTDWNGDNSARYMYNPTVRQKIVVRGNRQPIPVPFNTVDDEGIRNERRDLWVLGPGTSGLVPTFNHGPNCRVRNGAFVVPARTESALRFRDTDRPVSGRVNIHLLVSSPGLPARLGIDALNGTTSAAGSLLQFGPAYIWRAAFENLPINNLVINISNRGLTPVLIKQIVVERAPT